MSDLRTFYKHVSHYLAGRMGMMLLSLLSFALFTRLLTVADYGILGLVLKIVAAFTVLAKLGMQHAAMRFFHECQAAPHRNGLRRYYSTLLVGAIAAGAAVTLVFAVGVWLFPAHLLSPMLRNFLLLAAVLILIRGVEPVVQGFFRIEERTKAANAIDILTKAGDITAILAFFFLWQVGLRAFFLGLIVAESAVLVAFTWPLVRRGMVRLRQFDFSFFGPALAFALPMIGYELSNVVLDSGDRILVQHYLGAYPLGLYSAAYNIASYVQEFILLPVGLAFFPIFMKLWTTKGKTEAQQFLNRSMDSFLIGAVGLVVAVSLTARDTVSVLASAKYQEASSLLPVLVIGLMINALGAFVGNALFIHNKTMTMALLVTLACAVNIGMNIVLIPWMGLQGAALATLVSYALLTFLLYYYGQPLLTMRINVRSLVRCLAAAAVTFGLVSLVALHSAFASLAARGILSVALYGGLILLLDTTLRRQVLRAARDYRGSGQEEVLEEVTGAAKE